jgi:4-phytase / acid phosphatase
MTANADSLLISTSGEFSGSGISANSMAADGAEWTASFVINSMPAVSNLDAQSFDVSFSSFDYTLNGANVAAAPSSIRFYNNAAGGLFTLFFGPESGFMNGQAIPELSFEGDQAFTGALGNPSFASGSFSIVDWTYSDALNFDDHPTAGTTVSLAAVPEPSAVALSALAVGLFAAFRLRRKNAAAFALCALALALPFAPTKASAQTADDTTLKFALVFSRHGVRPPTKTNDAYQQYAVSPWPTWDVPVGDLTTHGAQLMTLMGKYYSAYFTQQGLLSGDPRKDVRRVYFYSDNAERTYATGQALAAGMFPTVPTTVNEYTPTSASDPLFYPVKVNLGSPDLNLAADALNGRIGSNPAALTASETLQFQLMESALFNQPITTDPTLAPPGLTSVAAIPLVVSPGSGGSIVGFAGGIDTASTLTEIFLLEYCDGKDPQDIAWGRLTKEQIQQVVQLHDLDFDLTDRTPYLAQTQGSNLLQHIRATINQAATGATTTQAIGAPYDAVLMLTGHDNQLAAVGGLMNVNWQLPGFAQNDTPPGGGFVYELRQRPDSSYVVRIYYISQTMDQMHDATPLSLQNGPAIAPIFLPGASTNTPYFDCPLAAFNAVVDRVVGVPFTN